MKSSAAELRNVLKEYVEGVRMGSIFIVERRKSGVELEMNVGMQACRRVTGKSFGAMEMEGRRAREG